MALFVLTVALYLLHRLGPIAVDVVQRHVANAAIGSFARTLVPLVGTFGASYTATSSQKARLTALLDASAAATGALFRATSAWLGPVGRDLPGFDGRGIGVNPSVDQDVLADARRLIDVVQTHAESLAYAPELQAELTRLIDAADAADTAAQQARVELQRQQGETRTLAGSLQRELVALRRTLRAELGPHHIDYQRLRMPRTRQAAETAVDVSESAAVTPVASQPSTSRI